MSYRGKKFENAASLSKANVYRGNFLEILRTIVMFDVVLKEHLNEVESKAKQGSGGRGQGNQLTLISKTTISNILDGIHDLIIETIVSEINNATMFSVMLDTTQDISVDDQCAIVVVYVTDQVYERLVGLKICHDTKGRAMFETLSDCVSSIGLNIKNIVESAADGAANMQGQYNGFMVYLTNASPEQIKVWCSAHVLNLVIQGTTSPVEESNLFSVLYSCATTIKESHKRMDLCKEEAPDSRRLGNIGETRWWSKHDALGKVYGKYGDSSAALFVCLIVM